MVCGFCSTGCGLNVHLKDGQAINLSADTDLSGESRHGLPQRLGSADAARRRRTAPPRRCCATSRPASSSRSTGSARWSSSASASRKSSAQHGPESVRLSWHRADRAPRKWPCSARSWKFGMGFIHCDSQYAPVHGHRRTWPTSSPSASMRRPSPTQDFEESDVLVFVGSNPCIAHPIMWQRVMRNQHRPEIIVVDPRKTETAMAATQHYAIQPKSDLVAALRPRQHPHRQRLDRSRFHRGAHHRLRGVRGVRHAIHHRRGARGDRADAG